MQGLEVSVTENSIACYVELFVSIYVCLMRIEINNNMVYVIHTCTHAQVYT